MPKIGLLIVLVFLSFTPALAMDFSQSSVTVSGNIYSRWVMSEGAVYAPYHSAYVFDLIPTIKVNDHISVEYLVRLENPSVSDGYSAKERLSGRGAIITKEFGWTLRAGNLGKVTLGKGLTLKDFEAQGFEIKSQIGESWEGGLTYISHGYSRPGDYGVPFIRSTDRQIGAYVLSYINDHAYFQTYNNVWGAYLGWEVLPFLTVNFEGTIPFGGLISPQIQFKSPEYTYFLAVTGRYYSKALNSPFQQYNFEKSYHGFEEEDEDFDNWRNYLLDTLFDPQNVIGVSVRLTAQQHVWGWIWLYGDLDITREFLQSTLDTTLFAYGIQVHPDPQQLVYFGLQNRILNSWGVIENEAGRDGYADRDIFRDVNARVISQINTQVVVGTQIWF
jgi:hypothetical protein